MPHAKSDKLLSKSAMLDAIHTRNQIVDDVLEKKVKQRTRSQKEFQPSPTVDPRGTTILTLQDFTELTYLPKGKMEPVNEYKKRVDLTPFFSESVDILEGRMGSMFSQPVELDGDDKAKYSDFAKSSTPDGKSLESVAAIAAAQIQKHGLNAIFVNRAPLPLDILQRIEEGKNISEEERTGRKLGFPQFVLYDSRQIHAIEMDARGLKWIKVVEHVNRQDSWDSAGKRVSIVRVINRTEILSWVVTQEEGKEDTVEALGPVLHDMKNDAGEDIVPVVVGQGPAGLGSSMLLDSAEADIAAFQVLSDRRWSAFLHSQPMLTFRTDRDDKDLMALHLGAHRYIPLRAGRGTIDGEELEYVQLDATGFETQRELHAEFVEKARQLGGKGGDSATITPTAESGVARAWRFKTGEERALFLTTHQLKLLMDPALDMVARYMTLDPDGITIKFNTQFDLSGPKEDLDVAERVLSIAKAHGLETAGRLALRKASNAIGRMSDGERQAIDLEIAAAASIETFSRVEATPKANGDKDSKEDDEEE